MSTSFVITDISIPALETSSKYHMLVRSYSMSYSTCNYHSWPAYLFHFTLKIYVNIFHSHQDWTICSQTQTFAGPQCVLQAAVAVQIRPSLFRQFTLC